MWGLLPRTDGVPFREDEEFEWLVKGRLDGAKEADWRFQLGSRKGGASRRLPRVTCHHATTPSLTQGAKGGATWGQARSWMEKEAAAMGLLGRPAWGHSVSSSLPGGDAQCVYCGGEQAGSTSEWAWLAWALPG